MRWTVLMLPAARQETEVLPIGLRTRIYRLMALVQEIGLEQMREPQVKHLEGKLWELRAVADEGHARGIYVTKAGRKVVVLHVFEKKTERTPLRALALARQRAKEIRP